METNPVCWFEIYVQDMDRAKKFYESVFQIKLEKLNNPLDYAELEFKNTFIFTLIIWSALRALNPSGRKLGKDPLLASLRGDF